MFRVSALVAALAFSSLTAFAQAPDYAAIAARCVPSLREEAVPRDERRQQILAGFYETRFSYSLAQVPHQTDCIAECYADGHLTHRYRLASAIHWEKPEYGHGTLSVAWNDARHELTLVNDNGFGLWNRHLTLAPDVFPSLLAVVGAENPKGELRETIDDLGVKALTFYPIIGMVGAPGDDGPRRITHFKLESTVDFLAQAAAEHAKDCVIIYLFANHGGHLPFPLDEKTDFYACSLPIQ